jgi:hypothetical protein
MTIFVQIDNGIVVNRAVFDGGIPDGWPNPEMWVANNEAQIGWTYSGGVFAPPVEPEPPPPTQADYAAAIQAHIDAVAQERSYNDAVSCASYAASTNTQWASEAATFIAWRDDVWTYAYTELAKVQAGTRPQPTVADFIAELPTITWP